MRKDNRHNNIKNITTQGYNFYSSPIPLLQGAACYNAGIDPDIYYPYPKRLNRDTMNTVKKICASCPVRVQCLEYAMVNDEEWGIWGGLTRKQRLILQKDRKSNAKSHTALIARQYLTPNRRGTQATV